MNSCKIIANTIRGLSVDGVAAANSGHPGMPLGWQMCVLFSGLNI